MDKEISVAAFEGGKLVFPAKGLTGKEIALALPLSRLLVKMVRVPADQNPVEFATPILKALSPYPDDPLAVSCETVAESAEGRIVIAAALPENSADDIAEALDAAKLNVCRIDALVFGALRGIWSELNIGEGDEKRRLVILRSSDCISLLVLDGDRPVAIRAIADDADLKRETTMLLLEAEDFGGARELAATIDRAVDVEPALVGTAERAADPQALDVMPESWREVLEETRFKGKMVRNLSIAGGIWLLIMAVLFGVPVGYGYMKDHVTTLCQRHSRTYKSVADKKARTELVHKYSDHARGALEIMKAVSDRLPGDITLTGWDFTREEGLRIRGEATEKNQILDFKDALTKMGAEEGGDPVFEVVKLGSVNSQKDGTQRFDLDCSYHAEEK